ncbi:hypothetical protein B0H10DRAFT_1183280 [Mycena sp. CBHHK59/15]|nr:hypothetical protein B0H10DRAFT_1183280 [Mycena sp. CBHHK59/15]
MPRAPRQSGAPRRQPAYLGYGRDACVDGFIRQLNAGGSQPPKPRLTVQQHADLRHNMSLASIAPAWARDTKLNVAAMLKKWKGYCELMQLGDWESILQTAGKGTAMSFLIHMCRTCDITSEGTSWEYFRQWKQLYSLATGQRMDTNDSADVLAFHKMTVVPCFKLSPPAARIKTVTDSGDLLALLSFNVAYDRRLFPGERRRLDLAACYLILAYRSSTARRPSRPTGAGTSCWAPRRVRPPPPNAPRRSATRTCSWWWCATRRRGGIPCQPKLE